MIVITGAAGFIASCLASRLYRENIAPLLLVDDFSKEGKQHNYSALKNARLMHRDEFPKWLEQHGAEVSFVFHLGARTDTTEFNKQIFDKLNVEYTKSLWNSCTKHGIPLVYASSAATYGDGEFGYDDDQALIPSLQPLNPYGWSKQVVDQWILEQKDTPPRWTGLKFFNVYGPNEYHKGRMASVIFHAYNQINENGRVKLFRSHRSDYKDGWQVRDFVYVKDIVEVCLFLLKNETQSGIYNLGSGKARSFYDLAASVFTALGKTPVVDFVDIPADIRDKYQYFTEANMKRMVALGFSLPFTSLEDGVKYYVSNYLQKKAYY
jgi:ADP-L-glycero-D-manno-heptose 6-epimerase